MYKQFYLIFIMFLSVMLLSSCSNSTQQKTNVIWKEVNLNVDWDKLPTIREVGKNQYVVLYTDINMHKDQLAYIKSNTIKWQKEYDNLEIKDDNNGLIISYSENQIHYNEKLDLAGNVLWKYPGIISDMNGRTFIITNNNQQYIYHMNDDGNISWNKGPFNEIKIIGNYSDNSSLIYYQSNDMYKIEKTNFTDSLFTFRPSNSLDCVPYFFCNENFYYQDATIEVFNSDGTETLDTPGIIYKINPHYIYIRDHLNFIKLDNNEKKLLADIDHILLILDNDNYYSIKNKIQKFDSNGNLIYSKDINNYHDEIYYADDFILYSTETNQLIELDSKGNEIFNQNFDQLYPFTKYITSSYPNTQIHYRFIIYSLNSIIKYIIIDDKGNILCNKAFDDTPILSEYSNDITVKKTKNGTFLINYKAQTGKSRLMGINSKGTFLFNYEVSDSFTFGHLYYYSNGDYLYWYLNDSDNKHYYAKMDQHFNQITIFSDQHYPKSISILHDYLIMASLSDNYIIKDKNLKTVFEGDYVGRKKTNDNHDSIYLKDKNNKVYEIELS